MVGSWPSASVFKSGVDSACRRCRFSIPLFHISSGLLLLIGILFRYHELGTDALSLQPLTDALEAGDTGALLSLAIGIKPLSLGFMFGLDGYAEAAIPGRFGYVRLPQNVRSVCLLVFIRVRIF